MKPESAWNLQRAMRHRKGAFPIPLSASPSWNSRKHHVRATLLANGSTPSDAKVERLAERIAVKHQKCSLKPHPLGTERADVKSNARDHPLSKKARTRHRLGSTVLKLRNVFLIRKIAAGLLIEERTRRLVVIVFRFWQ